MDSRNHSCVVPRSARYGIHKERSFACTVRSFRRGSIVNCINTTKRITRYLSNNYPPVTNCITSSFTQKEPEVSKVRWGNDYREIERGGGYIFARCNDFSYRHTVHVYGAIGPNGS